MAEVIDSERAKLLRDFFEARTNAGGWKKAADDLRTRIDEELYETLATDGILVDPDGVPVGKARHVPGKRFDVKRLRAERPEIYAEFETETDQVRLEVPK